MNEKFGNVPVHTQESIAREKEGKRNNLSAVRDLLVARKNHIEQLLPTHMDPGRLARLALLSIRKNPKLLDCHPESLVGAVIQAAQLGLEPDGTLGQAYLVPFKRECTLQIGYRGMIEIARRSGRVTKISAHVVYSKDQFVCSYGMEEKLEHIPTLSGERGDEIAVYAIATLKDGGHVFDVLTLEEINKARSSSKSANIWTSHWSEMAKKTAIRRLFKYLPISNEVAKAVALDEIGESGVNQHLGLTLSDDKTLVEDPIEDAPVIVEGKTDVKPSPKKEPKEKKQTKTIKTNNKKQDKKEEHIPEQQPLNVDEDGVVLDADGEPDPFA